MGRTKKMEVRCEHCREWSPSQIMIGDSESFDSTIMIGNKTRCPHCGQWTGLDKENLRAVFEDGGFSGKGT